MKGGKNAIKVLNNNNSTQIRKKTVKKRFIDGSLSSFTRFSRDVKRKRGGTGNTRRQLRRKEKECDELKDQRLALRLDNDSLCYIPLTVKIVVITWTARDQGTRRHRRRVQLSQLYRCGGDG